MQDSFRPESFTDPDQVIKRVGEIYDAAIKALQDKFQEFVTAGKLDQKFRVFYPYIQIANTASVSRRQNTLSYGFVSEPGLYRTTITRPDLYGRYLRKQCELLLENHNAPIEVGVSDDSIPLHFAFTEGMHLEGKLDLDGQDRIKDYFDVPDLSLIDDQIVNATAKNKPHRPKPLSLFTAGRVDFSLHRLKHYTATSPEHFQNFVLFTNYQFYIDEFVRLGRDMMQSDADPDRDVYNEFVEPGDVITPHRNLGTQASGTPPPRLPQMPAYHLKRKNNMGVTMVNIGVGPSNAKTITDHIAVLRPHAWLMLGHCAGLRDTQRLGDYALAHAYVREDHVLDEDLPTWVPIPALAEVQQALEGAVAEITGYRGRDLKEIMRTGTVATIDNRNWELYDHSDMVQRFSQSRAIALDMESATIAANGFRFRVPYGTLLCVSDKPLHGSLKLPGMANEFYRSQVDQHLQIGVRTMELLRKNGLESLHSRKLRSFAEVAFQ